MMSRTAGTPSWRGAAWALPWIITIGIGSYVFHHWALWMFTAYLFCALWIEVAHLLDDCVYCARYGTVCPLGRGKLCALLFRRGTRANAVDRLPRWWYRLADLLVFALPSGAAVVWLVHTPSWGTAVLLSVLVLNLILSQGWVNTRSECPRSGRGRADLPAE